MTDENPNPDARAYDNMIFYQEAAEVYEEYKDRVPDYQKVEMLYALGIEIPDYITHISSGSRCGEKHCSMCSIWVCPDADPCHLEMARCRGCG